MAFAGPPRTENDLAIKRVFDVGIAALMLIAFAPLMILIGVMVGLSSPGPILFRQTRSGMYGRRFGMFKFRTMIDGAEAMIRHSHRSITQGPIFKDPNDYRITPVGRFLRRFSLDELPQLFNVLSGDMSMVGPRPLPVYEADQITGESRRRFSVPPGITCLWQVAGRNNVGYEKWMQYDLQYVDEWSLWFDTILLLRTVPAVLGRKGAY
jgi:lipopolysaccharide/colanic/teichoic acid biosynthesis glycosyltransferase